MDISTLSDEELNRAMIWINPPAHGVFTDDECGVYSNSVRGHGCNKIDYLEDWSLTGPLMVKYMGSHRYEIDFYRDKDDDEYKVESLIDDCCYIFANINPLRAICEVIIMIEMANKS